MLIRSLDQGGAERQVVALAAGFHRRGMNVEVLTFYDGGVLRRELDQAGVPNVSLGKRGRWDVLPFLSRLLKHLRCSGSAVICSYLPVANLLLAVLKPWLLGSRVAWGLRASNVDLARYDWLSWMADKLEAVLAQRADVIITNSDAGFKHAASRGFPTDRLLVIPNGIDTNHFAFDGEGRKQVRAEWRIDHAEVLIGLAARLDPMKDHETFLHAAALVAQRRPKVRFVCVGAGPSGMERALRDRARRLGIAERVVWAGPRGDMPAVYSAFDILSSSSSFGEGFSNVIAEAMACERTCVVTDVGDSALIVGETGRVVPARNPEALARTWMEISALAGEERAAIGKRARKRIVQQFGIEALVTRTIAALGLAT